MWRWWRRRNSERLGPSPRYSGFPVKVTCKRIGHRIAESVSSLTNVLTYALRVPKTPESGSLMSQTEARDFATNGRNMSHGRRGSRDLTSETPTSLGRRNLPRASHACEWCRTKKVRCDQQQPCSNCIKHSIQCEYGTQRRSGRKETLRIQSKIRQSTVGREDQSSPLVSALVFQDDIPMSETPAQVRVPGPLGPTTPNLTTDSDGVGDINEHTHGTEFYGSSSNFVLLNQLFAYAQQHLPQEHAEHGGRNKSSQTSFRGTRSDDGPSVTGQNGQHIFDQRVSRPDLAASPVAGRIPVINLLSNEEALLPPSRPKTPHDETERQHNNITASSVASSLANNGVHLSPSQHDHGSQGRHHTSHSPSVTHSDANERLLSAARIRTAQRRLEREYVRVYLDNLHYLHPMLDSLAFIARCEENVWATDTLDEAIRPFRHFLALYNIVVAIGALIAGKSVTQKLRLDIQTCMEHMVPPQKTIKSVSSQALSRKYFQKSRALLGDVFEVCSLESAQTLLLMSLYCQNSHKPHACYMYCGQAVRTALAIGLVNGSMPNSVENIKAARRTWWCIYSHEIDMSCSSGRRDSLRKPRNYLIPLPLIQNQSISCSEAPEAEHSSVAMISEMVHFAAILRRVSKQLYHDSKGLTLLQKSTIAKELDALLEDWKNRLPAWLSFGKVCFFGEEWASKQSLVLQLRYLNARILIHRPFLAVPPGSGQLQTSTHVELCLNAARETLRVMYDAYAHRHYFRTWWYNSTYTLYAGFLVLYSVMLGHASVSSNELLDDATKAQHILESMEEATVARRSADLIREGLEVVQTYVQYRQNSSTSLDEAHMVPDDQYVGATQAHLNDTTWNVDNHIPRALFSWTGDGTDTGSLLAPLIDPNLLQDFTAGNNIMPGLGSSIVAFDGFDGLDADLMMSLS
ncbi:putative C6 transcription factor [Phaeosphaeria sp. MPI-PUGE-AT-0046c]|nr:putative C6 transcription factor [Phaeosphaeria sp. MPI-PUGE-AT-0046c]